jgi:uncharacterized membrane protein
MNRLNLITARVLVIGLLSSITLLVVGAVLTLARPDAVVVHETSVQGIPGAIAHLEARGFFDLGLLLLAATPVVRVAALLVGFAKRRMWWFAGLSLFVLAALALSASLGLLS